jgi:hypothetical protein
MSERVLEEIMTPVKIKPDKYGAAISLLITMGGSFQTRFEDTLIVDRDQRRALEQAGFVAANGAKARPRVGNGKKAK